MKQKDKQEDSNKTQMQKVSVQEVEKEKNVLGRI